ncbi:MAG TPA: 3,4-dihydroxy-2-butanone-4-phosphate synthase [Polyangia bacterium]|nr:3,4-dihydroxy-2-butanone-4-phosphate synthase [Polyangia bacterium]
MTSKERIARVVDALDDIRAGKMVILVDDEDRENEGDLTMAAEKVTPEAINFMAKHGRGLICLTLTEEKADALELPLQSARKGGGSPFGTAFTVSIEARRGVTTGISAKDRATTILTAVKEDARPEDLITPGHVFPLRAKRGGVLVRTGQTEGSVDLSRLAGLSPAGVICEIMNDDGSMARMPDLERFAVQHQLRILSIADLIEYRLQQESLVEKAATAPLMPTLPGVTADFTAHVYTTPVEKTEYLALTMGDVRSGDPVLVRVQTACFPGDVFGSAACDCGAQLAAALQAIERAGRGVLLYVIPSGRHSLLGDFKAHVLHEETARVAGREHKLRDFGLGAQVLSALGVKDLRLLTNNPKKIAGLEGYGMCVVERVPLEMPATRHNLALMRDKRDREGHLFSVETKEKP